MEDVYALGFVLYELFSGTEAFSGFNPFEIAFKKAAMDYPPVSTLPDSLADVITRCWNNCSDERPALEEIRGVLVDSLPDSYHVTGDVTGVGVERDFSSYQQPTQRSETPVNQLEHHTHPLIAENVDLNERLSAQSILIEELLQTISDLNSETTQQMPKPNHIPIPSPKPKPKPVANGVIKNSVEFSYSLMWPGYTLSPNRLSVTSPVYLFGRCFTDIERMRTRREFNDEYGLGFILGDSPFSPGKIYSYKVRFGGPGSASIGVVDSNGISSDCSRLTGNNSCYITSNQYRKNPSGTMGMTSNFSQPNSFKASSSQTRMTGPMRVFRDGEVLTVNVDLIQNIITITNADRTINCTGSLPVLDDDVWYPLFRVRGNARDVEAELKIV
ncbi:hypothetical protein GEMRC1_013978 [Eukaryota sp. GEM-RC1]